MELVSLVFYLAGTPGYKGSLVPEYLKDIEMGFCAYENHAAVDMARKLMHDHSVSYDAVVQFAFYFNNVIELKWTPAPETRIQLDSRWPREQIPVFLELLRDFSKKSRFSTFAAQHRSLYQRWSDSIRKKTHSSNALLWVGQFFGDVDTPSFKIVPSFLTGGFSYGITVSSGNE